jgi:TolB protein
VLSQVVAGSSQRNALLAAADLAVKATTGLNGYFTSRLAFVRESGGKHEIYTSDLFAGEIRQMTHDNSLALTPRWSPDGSRIVYTGYYRMGSPEIFQIDLRTMQRTRLVGLRGTNTGARFSPDGSRMAMVLSGEGNPEIYVADAQARGIRRITRMPSVEASPCFSPDGSKIIFASDVAGGVKLFTMPVGGGSASRVATNISGYCAEPDWSTADPDKIAFTVAQKPGFQVAVFDLKTREAKVVSRAPMDAIEPSWLPDGRHLVYTRRSANQRELHILDTGSGRSTRVSLPALGQCSQASVWRP